MPGFRLTQTAWTTFSRCRECAGGPSICSTLNTEPGSVSWPVRRVPCLAGVGWLENCAPESYSERQIEELDRLIEPWLDDYARVRSR